MKSERIARPEQIDDAQHERNKRRVAHLHPMFAPAEGPPTDCGCPLFARKQGRTLRYLIVHVPDCEGE